MAGEPLVEYNPDWPLLFEKEKRKILGAIGKKVASIEHVGSTSVPGLQARPVIDILVGVGRLKDGRNLARDLGRIGFEFRISFRDRLYFRKGKPGANTHHLHLVRQGGREWKDLLGFRDYLRTHPREAHRYYLLKKRLFESRSSREEIARAKTVFVSSALSKAMSLP